jgi:hypothetical protein
MIRSGEIAIFHRCSQVYALAMKKWVARGAVAALIIFAIACVAIWIYVPSKTVCERETYAAISAFLTPRLTGDSHDLGSRGELVVILDHTSSGQMRFLWTDRLNRTSRTERALMFLSSLHTSKFESKFSIPAPYKLVPSTESPGYSDADQHASYGMMTFSHVTFNHDATRATFYMEHLCGMCGEGAYIVLEKQDGLWHVTDGAGTWIS